MSNETSPLISAMESGVALTENGCVTNLSSDSAIVDLFFKIAAMRHASDEEIIELFDKAANENIEAAYKILFWARDIRGGQGERRVFRTIVRHFAEKDSIALRMNMKLIPEYGRWDDMFVFFGTNLEDDALSYISSALKSDSPGLCAKWMPREKSSKAMIAKKIRKYMGLNSKQYRKLLSSATSVVENNMCSKNWDNINYSHIPSVAMNNYKRAFARHTPEKWLEYLSRLEKGEAKVNSSALYPHQVVKSLLDSRWAVVSEDEIRIAEQQWKALPNYLLNNPYKILPVIDTSGSMCTDESPSPIEVAVSLGIYISERNDGPFKDSFVTFSKRPRLQRIFGDNLRERVLNLSKADWGMNTDICAVFNLILTSAIKGGIQKEDMPNMILILSDMEFDQADDFNLTAMESIREKYSIAGYDLPNIVFWNLAARGSNVPVKFHESGAALVSGFSPSILTQILSSGEISPIAIVSEVLSSERYAAISIF